MPRTRRRRLALGAGGWSASIGIGAVAAAARQPDDQLASGLALGLGAVTIGLGLVWWGRRTYAAALAADLSGAGGGRLPADTLPMGAELQGGRIGLRTATSWTWMVGLLAALFAGLGSGLVWDARGGTDSVIAGLGIMVFSALLTLLLLLVAGTVYWLDATGIARDRFPGTRVRWADVRSVRLDPRGGAVWLGAPGAVETLGGRRRDRMGIAALTLEITVSDLHRLVWMLWQLAGSDGAP